MRIEPNIVKSYRIEDCINCGGLAMVYAGLVLHTSIGEIHLDAERCLDGCDPLITEVVVHS